MTATSFEPQSFLRFDLSSGQLSARGADRHFVVPAYVLESAGSSDGLEEAARRWGAEQGEHLASLSAGDVLAEAPESFVTNLTALMAALGWGRPSLESWGGVLFAVVDEAPSGAGKEILAAFFAGLFAAVGKADFGCVPVEEGRFLIADAAGVAAVREWIGQGAAVGDVVARMHAGEHLKAGGR